MCVCVCVCVCAQMSEQRVQEAQQRASVCEQRAVEQSRLADELSTKVHTIYYHCM